MTVEVFPAINGDCFLIHTDEGIILLDCGYVSTYTDHLKEELVKLNKENKSLLRLIITHIDEDHIQGAIKFLSENGNSSNPQIIKIEQIWHNSFRHLQALRSEEKVGPEGIALLKSSIRSDETHEEKRVSAKQGSSLASLILENGYNWNSDFAGKAFSIDNLSSLTIGGGLNFDFLSPSNLALARLEKYWRKELYKLGFRDKITQEQIFDDAFEFVLMKEKTVPDSSIYKTVSESDFNVESLKMSKCDADQSVKNQSSLAFSLEYKGKKILFLGDAIPAVVETELERKYAEQTKPLQFDLVKLSHHGSYANNSPKLFEIADAKSYLISTKGETKPHPSKSTLAWVIGRPTEQVRKIYFNYKNASYDLLNNQVLEQKYKYVALLANEPSNRKIEL